MRTRSGELVTVSMVITGTAAPMRAALRFRSGGVMVTRPVGVFDVETAGAALKLAWERVRIEKIAEANEWEWAHP